MDDELLISAVFKRQILWDPNEELHKHPGVLRKLWEEVAQEINKDVKSVKARWKNLRTYFIRECRKIKKPSSGDGADVLSTSSWCLFQKLTFLKSTTSISQSDSSLVQETHNIQESLSVEEDKPSDDTRPTTPMSTERFFPDKSLPVWKRKRLHDNTEALLEIERKKIELLEKESTKSINEDSLFFDSLLPYMKEIPKIRKLRLRNKIQELILNELENLENVPSTSTLPNIK